MTEKTIDDVLSNLKRTRKQGDTFNNINKPLTTWIPNAYKDKYIQLQTESGLDFGKKLREIIIMAIEKAEQRAE